ncbi:hypothetical protein GGS21DRAFT_301968 [Xylaria nigripes]|nr:hypothetical protein GGS21DRAFT_301968 [Xylaria nigripes]
MCGRPLKPTVIYTSSIKLNVNHIHTPTDLLIGRFRLQTEATSIIVVNGIFVWFSYPCERCIDILFLLSLVIIHCVHYAMPGTPLMKLQYCLTGGQPTGPSAT